MLDIIKIDTTNRESYINMIKEWKENGNDLKPCIIEYDCSNSIDELNYDSTMKVADDYSKGLVFDYDRYNFKSSDFLFIVYNNKLAGMIEIRHNLLENGQKNKGTFSIGIRPSMRNIIHVKDIINLAIKRINDEDIFVLCEDKEIQKSLIDLNYLLDENFKVKLTKKYTKKV